MRRFRLEATNHHAREFRQQALDAVDYGDVHWVRKGDEYFGETNSTSALVEQFVGMAGCHELHDERHGEREAGGHAGGGPSSPREPGRSGEGHGKSDSAPGRAGDAGKSEDAPGHTGELPEQARGVGGAGKSEDAPGQEKKQDG